MSVNAHGPCLRRGLLISAAAAVGLLAVGCLDAGGGAVVESMRIEDGAVRAGQARHHEFASSSYWFKQSHAFEFSWDNIRLCLNANGRWPCLMCDLQNSCESPTGDDPVLTPRPVLVAEQAELSAMGRPTVTSTDVVNLSPSQCAQSVSVTANETVRIRLYGSDDQRAPDETFPVPTIGVFAMEVGSTPLPPFAMERVPDGRGLHWWWSADMITVEGCEQRFASEPLDVPAVCDVGPGVREADWTDNFDASIRVNRIRVFRGRYRSNMGGEVDTVGRETACLFDASQEITHLVKFVAVSRRRSALSARLQPELLGLGSRSCCVNPDDPQIDLQTGCIVPVEGTDEISDDDFTCDMTPDQRALRGEPLAATPAFLVRRAGETTSGVDEPILADNVNERGPAAWMIKFASDPMLASGETVGIEFTLQ